jgi:hypothetical protein
MRTVARPVLSIFCAGFFAVCFTIPSQAHKGVTSKFTYNAEVYPIFLAHCGHCHVAKGVGPMSLLTYQEAFPWAESLRTELLQTEESPSLGSFDSFVRAAHRDVPARDLDVILDWATGGTPEGDPAKSPTPVTLQNAWTHGQPHLALRPAAEYQMPADTMDATQEFVLPITLADERTVNAIDVLPGTPAIVRDVELLVRSANAGERSVGTWAPKQNPAPIVLEPAMRLAPGSEVIARIHYKKTWKYEGQPMNDRSTIGLYFAP